MMKEIILKTDYNLLGLIFRKRFNQRYQLYDVMVRPIQYPQFSRSENFLSKTLVFNVIPICIPLNFNVIVSQRNVNPIFPEMLLKCSIKSLVSQITRYILQRAIHTHESK